MLHDRPRIGNGEGGTSGPREGAGFPGAQSAGWGWAQHILASLNSNGRAGIVLDTRHADSVRASSRCAGSSAGFTASLCRVDRISSSDTPMARDRPQHTWREWGRNRPLRPGIAVRSPAESGPWRAARQTGGRFRRGWGWKTPPVCSLSSQWPGQRSVPVGRGISWLYHPFGKRRTPAGGKRTDRACSWHRPSPSPFAVVQMREPSVLVARRVRIYRRGTSRRGANRLNLDNTTRISFTRAGREKNSHEPLQLPCGYVQLANKNSPDLSQ